MRTATKPLWKTNKTTIALVVTGGELCAMCHEAKKDPVLHGPYKNGLCLAWHQDRRVSGETIQLFTTVSLTASDFAQVPKIELDPTGRFGHPWMGHPVAEQPDPLRKGEKISCLSCHQPHSSTLPSLIVAVRSGKDVCDTRHQAVEPRNLR